jgi:predicted ATPase
MIYLQHVVIRNHKVIQNLTLDFAGQKPVTVLVGKNGAGKTTVLESLTAIFAALHQRVEGLPVQAPAFDFDLTYRIGDEAGFVVVQVSGQHSQAKTLQTVIDGEAGRPLTKALLPNLVIYYPGASPVLKGLYQSFENDRKDSLRRRPTRSDESRIKDLPIFYAQPIHYELLLATLCAYEYRFFREKLRVTVSDKTTVGLFIKPNQFRQGADWREFWGADGEVRRFLDTIRECSYSETFTDTSAGKGLSYVFNKQNWYDLRAAYGEEKTLFFLLNMLHASDLLDGIWVTLESVGDKKSIFNHHVLSEGERQSVILKRLTELLYAENTLFLLDEPNVFMHPDWQSRFMDELSDYTERASFVITTHSPIMLSGISKGHLIRMVAGQAEPITGHYYGRQYSDNLEDILGVPARSPEFTTELQTLFNLIDEEEYDAADVKLTALREQLGDDDSDIVRAQTMLNFYR